MGKFDVTALVERFARLGVHQDDTDEICLQKTTMVRGSAMFTLAGLVWGVVYIALGEARSAWIPLSYAAFSSISIIYFGFSKRFDIFRATQLFLILVLPFLLMISLGGFINSSAVILWSLLCPLGALMFSHPRPALRWFIAFLTLVILSGFLQVYARTQDHLPPQIVTVFFVANIGAVSAIVFVLLRRFMLEKDQALRLLAVEQERSERLLLNVLPKDIAAILKAGERTIADHFDCASVLFADLEGFTPLTA
jgi:guanylate cyclase